ncbi:MAG: hypothetical protein BJ554DRAFT_7412, partial [Olpidium bornovanus]
METKQRLARKSRRRTAASEDSHTTPTRRAGSRRRSRFRRNPNQARLRSRPSSAAFCRSSRQGRRHRRRALGPCADVAASEAAASSGAGITADKSARSTTALPPPLPPTPATEPRRSNGFFAYAPGPLRLPLVISSSLPCKSSRRASHSVNSIPAAKAAGPRERAPQEAGGRNTLPSTAAGKQNRPEHSRAPSRSPKERARRFRQIPHGVQRPRRAGGRHPRRRPRRAVRLPENGGRLPPPCRPDRA